MKVIRLKSITALLFGILFLAVSCATKYHAINPWTRCGYVERKEAVTTYWIQFIGNPFTPAERMALFLTYRCAELTLEKGFTHYYHVTPELRIDYRPIDAPWTRIVLTDGAKPDSIEVELIDAAEKLKELNPKLAPYRTKK